MRLIPGKFDDAEVQRSSTVARLPTGRRGGLAPGMGGDAAEQDRFHLTPAQHAVKRGSKLGMENSGKQEVCTASACMTVTPKPHEAVADG